MTQQNKDFSGQKKEIELSLARTILTQLDKRVITFEQASEIARHIVSKLESATDEKKLLDLLQEIAKRWDIFSTTHGFYKMRLHEEKSVASLAV